MKTNHLKDLDRDTLTQLFEKVPLKKTNFWIDLFYVNLDSCKNTSATVIKRHFGHLTYDTRTFKTIKPTWSQYLKASTSTQGVYLTDRDINKNEYKANMQAVA